ncbi:MAG TPA: ABC transporter permease [Coleofasciculaceae cyanobacterium]
MRILSQCLKELAQFRRDRLTLALAFILPFMTLLIFGFAIRLESKNIPLFVQNFDTSSLSRSYIERLFATNQFVPINNSRYPLIDNLQNPESRLQNPEDVIDSGLAKVAVIIPPDFSRQIKSGYPSTVQVLVDATDVNNARIIKNSIQATTQFFLRDSGLQPTTNKITAHVRLWFNPGRKESLSIIPGLFALILWIYPSLITAVAMVREKEKGTILQVYASSLTAVELLIGKGLAFLLVGISEAILVITVGALIWQLRFAGDPTPLLLGTLVFVADSVLFGLLIGVRTNEQNSAVQAVALLGFLTALLLSGFIYPLSNIPFPLSLIPNIVPARYYIEITRDAFVRGTGWVGVWLSILMLVVLGIFIFRAAYFGLKRMQLKS